MMEVPFALVVRTSPEVVNDDRKREKLEARIKKTIGAECPPILVISHDDDIDLITTEREVESWSN